MKENSLNFSLLSVIFCLFVAVSLVIADGDHSVSRHLQYYSFREPFFPDAGSRAIPYWEIKGETVVHDDLVRLTPDVQNKRGLMTSRKPCTMVTLEMTLSFRIWSPNYKNLGADGLGFWITEKPIESGTVFGANDFWNGILITIDTFDNGGTRGNQARISIHTNDGSKSYQMHTEGQDTIQSFCDMGLRNADMSYLHIFYENGKFNLFVDTHGRGTWIKCGSPVAVSLPKSYFLGISAATGGLSDNHDVYALFVNTMDPPGSLGAALRDPKLDAEEDEVALRIHGNRNKNSNFIQLESRDRLEQIKSAFDANKADNTPTDIQEQIEEDKRELRRLQFEKEQQQQFQQQQQQQQQFQQQQQQQQPEPVYRSRVEGGEQPWEEKQAIMLHEITDNVYHLIEMISALNDLVVNLVNKNNQVQPVSQTSTGNTITNNNELLITTISGFMREFELKLAGNLGTTTQRIGDLQNGIASLQNLEKSLPPALVSTLSNEIQELKKQLNLIMDSGSNRVIVEMEAKILRLDTIISGALKPVATLSQDLTRSTDRISSNLNQLGNELNNAQGSNWLVYVIIVLQIVILAVLLKPKSRKKLF